LQKTLVVFSTHNVQNGIRHSAVPTVVTIA
jgi:hypothetical protein